MHITKAEKQIIAQIKALLDEAETLLVSLSNETQENINDFHNENYSLNHCIRWGIQASDELTR